MVARLVLFPDDIEHARETSILNLRDPRAVLQRGVVDGVEEQITLSDAIEEYVIKKVRDPLNVITGVKYTDPADRDLVTREYEGELQRSFDDLLDTGTEVADSGFVDFFAPLLGPLGVTEQIRDSIIHGSAHGLRSLVGMKQRDGGFEFNSVTPYDALLMILDEFEVEAWVDKEGTLWIGHAAAQGNLWSLGSEEDQLFATGVNVIESAVPYTMVAAEGTYSDFSYTNPVDGSQPGTFRVRASSHWVDSGSSGRTMFLEPKKVDEPEDLERIVETALRKLIYDHSTGTINILPMRRGTVTEGIENLSLGDHVLITPRSVNCERGVKGGIYAIRGISHRMNADDGWTIVLRVGLLVLDDSILTESKITAPGIDGWMDASSFYPPYWINPTEWLGGF